MKFKPKFNLILVQPDTPEEKTKSGIIIPDTAKEKPQTGIVLEVGDGRPEEPMTLKKGDRIMYHKNSGAEITLEGKTYLVMPEYPSVIAVLEK